MISFQVKAKHPPVISEGLNLYPRSTSWLQTSRPLGSSSFGFATDLTSKHTQATHQNRVPTKTITEIETQNTSTNRPRRYRRATNRGVRSTSQLAASHQLSQIDFYFISIPPHGSGAFPGASAVSSFLSSSLRPLFVRLVNARSWFYFPFAGPLAIPMVGAPGNTPEPSPSNEFR